MLRDKLAYLSQGAEVVVLAGSLPRGLSEHLYAELIHELAQRHIPVVLDSDGEPLRYGVQAEPFLVSPNQAEAEALVGQEFHDDEDFLLGLDEIAELGARNVIITSESGCFALLRDGREQRRFRALAPHVEAISRVGGGDVLLAAYLAQRGAERSIEASLGLAVGAGAASTLELGAGRFDPRQAQRLAAGAEVVELAPVS
jgi:fructose-1-phosphate kinase PfkB-like protein